MAQAQEAELLYKVRVEASQAIKDMQAASGQLRDFQKEAANSSSKMSGMQMGVKNASYQLQDFVVQTSMGTDALRAFGQQAPQLLMSFGLAGAVLGVVASLLPAVISGIKSMGDASARAAADVKRWGDEIDELGKMGKEIESFAKSITANAADGFRAYVDEYNKASKAQRTEMEAWLKLKLEVEQAKLNDIASEMQGRNIDFGAAMGGQPGESVNYGPDKQRMVELGSQYRIQADNVKRLSAAVSGDLKTAMQGNAADTKEAIKAQKEWEKAQDKQIDQIQKEFDALQRLSESRTKEADALRAMSDPMAAYNISLEKARVLLNDNKISLEEYDKAVYRASTTLANSNKVVNGFGDALTNAFTGAMLAGKSFGQVMAGLAVDIQNTIVKIMIIEPMIRSLKAAMVGSGLFGGAEYTAATPGFIGPVASANGNVFSGGISSGSSNVIPFAKGGVLSSPSYFPMAGGKTGLAGEAGHEAIMPLKRDAQGKLGVSGGVGGSNTQVNIYNQSGGEVETKERKDDNGMSVLDIYIKRAVADGFAKGDFDKSMTNTYGIRRQGTR